MIQSSLKETVQTVTEGRKYLEKEFQRLGITFWSSQGNFFIIDPPVPEFEFTDLLMNEGVMVRPVSQFGAPGKVRITVGTKEANKALVDALEKINPAK